MLRYEDFLASKHPVVPLSGFEVVPDGISKQLFRFQQDIVRWSLRLGRAALFANVGLGKTAMQLEWAWHVAEHTKKPVLILAPLAVDPQTVREGNKFAIEVTHVSDGSQVDNPEGIYITNYERVHLFDPAMFGGIVLDESSILKHYSKTFFSLVEMFEATPFKLCCTATPAPNDFVEFGNHALFLGLMHFKDMLARWFVGEGDVARVARLKAHGREDFWRWITSWAVCISKPSDLGDEYHMDGYDLPPLTIHEMTMEVGQAAIDRAWGQGKLLPDVRVNATSFMKVKRESLPGRVEIVREIMAGIAPDEPVIIWCDTDFEADALLAAFPDAAEVRGSHSSQHKTAMLTAFGEGRERVIITKPEIAGFGLNFQHCCKMIFAGLSFSFERWYQALGRVHRFGQNREVDVWMVSSDTEESVSATLARKRQQFSDMQAEMNAAMKKYGLFREGNLTTTYSDASPAGVVKTEGKGWEFYLGDCIKTMPLLEPDSVHLTVTSIPFSNLYIYSDSDADVGNSSDKDEFFEHLAYVIGELHRITVPGRCCAVHVKDLPLFINRDGYQGIDPFSDDTTAAFRDLRVCECGWWGSARRDGNACEGCGKTSRPGWVLQSRVTIEKDPVIEMQKTNSHGLLFQNWRLRSEVLRVGLPDYVLIFQKIGESAVPVVHDPADTTYHGGKSIAAYRFPTLPSRKTGEVNSALPIWQEYANPNWSDVVVPLVWTDVNQTDVLNYLIARDDKDERHLCPLQLDLIARLIHWKSNPGDVICDPFGGVGSTGVKALELRRKFVGMELKEGYHHLGTKYLRQTEVEMNRPSLFDLLEVAVE